MACLEKQMKKWQPRERTEDGCQHIRGPEEIVVDGNTNWIIAVAAL
jgi:hypothetical protein